MRFALPFLYNSYRSLMRNPSSRLWVVLGTLFYLLSPLDISPDVIPIVGQIDDFALMSIFFTELFAIAGDWFRERRDRSTGIHTDPETGEKIVDVDAVTVE